MTDDGTIDTDEPTAPAPAAALELDNPVNDAVEEAQENAEDNEALRAANGAGGDDSTAPVTPVYARGATMGPASAAPSPPTGAPGAAPPTAVPMAGGPPGQGQPPSSAPMQTKPMIDPRPWLNLQRDNPKVAAEVQQVADKYGVTPERLALHWQLESSMRLQAPDGDAGERGPFQILPQTQHDVDPKNTLDPRDWRDGLELEARVVAGHDRTYGRDSISSVAAYQAGEGNVDRIANDKGNAEQVHPTTMAYARKAFVNHTVTADDFIARGPHDASDAAGADHARDLVNAGTQGGPDGFLRQVMQTAPRGMGPNDAWRNAENSMVQYFLQKGDITGAQHATDWVLQMAHAGSNQNLMAAQRSLSAGDTTSAIQYLAKAHAFFPDDSVGHFGVDTQGRIWGERVDEHDPGRVIGQPFEVTPQTISTMLNQTARPADFLKTLQAQQLANANARKLYLQGNSYAERYPTMQAIAAGHDAASERDADVRAGASAYTADQLRAGRENSAAIRAAGVGNQNQNRGMPTQEQISSDAEKHYGSAGDTPGASPQQIQGYATLRQAGMTDPTAKALTDGLANRSLGLRQMQDGTYGIVDKQGRPVTYVAKALGDRLLGRAPENPPQALRPGVPGGPTAGNSPVGAMANSPYMYGAQMTNPNLAGAARGPAQVPQSENPPLQPVDQSSAVPVQ